MLRLFRLVALPTVFLNLIGAALIPVSAQITPDDTLGNERSVVVESSAMEAISGGAYRGSNLFHSFDEFNVPLDRAVYFIGSSSLERIFVRVTGQNPSSILGTLGILGSDSDLVLLNSNGITFGPESRLSLAGSFLGTTADSIQFLDSTSFANIGDARTSSLLTNSIPIGLGFTGNSSISVQNVGHTYIGNTFAPIEESAPQPGLSVLPQQTIALIAGNVNFDGGIVRVPNGQIELAGVREGVVKLDAETRWAFDYSSVNELGDVHLSGISLLETNGFFGGLISLIGRTIDVDGGSVVFSRNIIGPSSGAIRLNASDSINITGGVPAQSSGSAILSQNLGIGKGGDIIIAAPNLTLQDGGQITTDTFSTDPAGDISIDVIGDVRVLAFQPSAEFLFSNISTATFAEGQAGNLRLSAGRLKLSSGAQVGSATFGSGNGGSAIVNARDIVLDGVTPTNLTPASINAAAFRTGNAGRLEISTDTLRVLNGARVGTSTVNLGNAGNTFIRASQLVEVSGSFPGSRNPSLIDSSANFLDPSLAGTLEVPSSAQGDAGSVEIFTPSLVISDGGLITVQNEGSGDAGTLLVSAEDIRLITSGAISASTNGGNGGNIDLMTRSLIVATGSNITTSATGQGQGGNIVIDSDAIALLPNSSITANAAQGSGGQVVISTDALLQSPNSFITATSAASPELDGTIDIQAPNETIRTDAEVSPQTISVPEITAVCSGGNRRSELVVTGRGGLPISPTGIQQNYSGWQLPESSVANSEPNPNFQITEAQGWMINGDGTVSFTNQTATPVNTVQSTACVQGSSAQNRS